MYPIQGPYHFIVNPTAGGGRTARLWPRIQHRLAQEKIDFTWTMPQSTEEAITAAAKSPEGGPVVSVGGDGSLHAIVSGLPTGQPIGVIPTGQNNFFARSAGLSESPPQALKQLLTGELRLIDLPSVNGRPFVNGVSIRLDRRMPRPTPQRSRHGLFHAISHFVARMTHHPSRRIRVALDGRQTEGDILFVSVGNGRYHAGGPKYGSTAHFDDGLLDVLIASRPDKADLLFSFMGAFGGGRLRRRAWLHTKVHELTIEGPDDMVIHADGESAGHLPAQFVLKRRALPVIIPRGQWTPSKVVSIRRRLGEAGASKVLQ